MLDRDGTLMTVAYVYQNQSTCDRNHVGAVISIDGRIIATGYNGAPAGMPHCEHKTLVSFDEGLPQRHNEEGCKIAVHAESNAVAFAAKHGLPIKGATLHTTLSPCYVCSQLIINAGLVRVVFDRPYRDHSGLHLLRDAGITVDNVSP